MRGMRTKGADYDTNFGVMKKSDVALPLERVQNDIEKSAIYFDQYDVRVTVETRAGISDVNYSQVLNAMADAGMKYKEERRYNLQPDRVMMDILIHKEDIELVTALNKELEPDGITFTINTNVSESIFPRTIVTPEEDMDKTKEEAKELGVKAAKKVAGLQLEVNTTGDSEKLTNDIAEKLDTRYKEMGKNQEQFEQSLDTIALDIASNMGAQYAREGDTLVFNFDAAKTAAKTTADSLDEPVENIGAQKDYYVPYSSWFDDNEYDAEKISAVVTSGGGENVRIEPAYGWDNQPDVVVFTPALPVFESLQAINSALEEALGTEWVDTQEKDWGVEASKKTSSVDDSMAKLKEEGSLKRLVMHDAQNTKVIEIIKDNGEGGYERWNLAVGGGWKERMNSHLTEEDVRAHIEKSIARMNEQNEKPTLSAKKMAKAPPGWEGTVKKMKDHEEIDNPYALSHWMNNKGYKPSASVAQIKEAALKMAADTPNYDMSAGFAINTSSEDQIEDHAEVSGVHLEVVTWEKINKAIGQMEANTLQFLRDNYNMFCRDEGHSDDSLIGSCWPKEGSEQKVKDLWDSHNEHEGDEPLYLSDAAIYSGVDEYVAKFIDVWVTFFAVEGVTDDNVEASLKTGSTAKTFPFKVPK